MKLGPSLLLLPLVCVARPALPCSPAQCLEPSLLATGPVPANVSGLVLSPRAGYSGPIETTSVTLSADDGQRVPVRVERRTMHFVDVVLEAPLRPGVTYHLDHRSLCSGEEGRPAERFSFPTTASAPAPTELGRLVSRDLGTTRLAVDGGPACTRDITAAQVEVELELAASAEPWQHVLEYETYVDGQRWNPTHSIGFQGFDFGTSWHGRKKDLLYSDCETRPGFLRMGLEPGPHDVEIRASYRGGPTVSATARVTLTLACPGPQADGGAQTDGATLPVEPPASGCQATPTSAPWLMLALALALRRRVIR